MVDWKAAGPPARPGRGSTLHKDIITELQTRPGVWAVVRTFAVAPKQSRGVADASTARLRELGAVATTRRNGGVLEVWAMWPMQHRSTNPQHEGAPHGNAD